MTAALRHLRTLGTLSALLFCASLAAAAEPVGAEEADRARIRAHLTRVEDTLRARDASHLGTAQREARRQNLDRLHAYRERGIFPRNRDFEGQRQPYFVDGDGRACAVAYLVVASGAESLAERIVATENNARLGDMQTPGLAAWVASSGLTAEECALIQPDYCYCSNEDLPVCGTDGVSYKNECTARNCGGTNVATCGICDAGPIVDGEACGDQCFSDGATYGCGSTCGGCTTVNVPPPSDGPLDDGHSPHEKSCAIANAGRGGPGACGAMVALGSVALLAMRRRTRRPRPSRVDWSGRS